MNNLPLPPEPPAIILPPRPNDPNAEFLWVLEHIIGLTTPPQRDRVTVRGGVTSIDDLLLVDMDSLLDCLTDNTSVMAKTRLKALKLWVEEQNDMNNHVNLNEFTMDICRMKQMQIAKTTTKAKTGSTDISSSTKDKLRNFNGKREVWLNAKRELTAYLNQLYNENGIPLYYVIRDPQDEELYRNNNGELGNKIYDAPFHGRIYDDDAFRVIQILRLWTTNGTAQTHVDQSNDVQDAWNRLLTIYEGRDAKSSNIQHARLMISKATWSRNTTNYTFDDYCNKHIKYNNELTRYGVPTDEGTKVRAFLDGIKVGHNAYLPALKMNIRQNPLCRDNLTEAIISAKDTLRDTPEAIGNNSDQRQVGATYRGGGRGYQGGRNGRGYNSGRGGRGSRYTNNGRGYGGRSNNYTSTTTNDKGIFIPDEVFNAVPKKFHTLLYKGREQVEKETNNVHPSRANRPNNNETRTTSSVEVLDDNDQQFIDDNTNSSSTIDTGGASSKFGATGRNNKKSRIGAITSSIRRISQSSTNDVKHKYNYELRARAEIDTRADTLCAGSTFILYEATGKVVDVTGFHDSFNSIKDIPVGTCITAIDLNGETIIGCFHQSLYFGNTMQTSLIPPSQLWDHGITVDVVPKQYSDGKSLFGIHHPNENVFIPFHLHGCISYFITRLPTPDEINNCRWVTFTSEAEWQPYSDHFKEAERAVNNYYHNPDPTHPHYNHDGELLNGRQIKCIKTINDNVDPYLCTFDFAYERFISATSSTVHRTNVPVEVLARRWGTSLNTAQRTLQNTTQLGKVGRGY